MNSHQELGLSTLKILENQFLAMTGKRLKKNKFSLILEINCIRYSISLKGEEEAEVETEDDNNVNEEDVEEYEEHNPFSRDYGLKTMLMTRGMKNH